MIFRKLKELESVISMSVLDPVMGEQGWQFGDGPDSPTRSTASTGSARSICSPIRAIPAASRCRCCGTRSAAPSSTTNCPRSSACSIRRSQVCTNDRADYYPQELRAEIDRINARVYNDVNIGVYRAGFATEQAAYEDGCRAVFAALDWIEELLSRQRYLVGARLTEADWRLFTTLVRFDAVYYSHFKCNLRRIVDYPQLVELSARSLSGARHCRHREFGSHQAALLHEHDRDQSDAHRAARAKARPFSTA